VSKLSSKSLRGYADLLREVKSRIQQAQTKAILSANAVMIRLYWDIGHLLVQQQARQGWGAGVLRRLATDIPNELPGVKGFSERNLKLMSQFYREYPVGNVIGQPVVAQLPREPSGAIVTAQSATLSAKVQQLVAQLPWAHNVLLIQKVKDLDTRLWYMQQTIENGWSRNILGMMIDSRTHLRQGKAITNFAAQLPPAQSDLALQTFKDPYIFDFLALEATFHERELETQLLRHLEKFLIELGQGFAFVGRQYHIVVGDEDFYIDLLFYHLRLRCFVVIDLKTGAFKAEFAGKMNFYLNTIDEQLRQAADGPSVGLILCQQRNRVIAEYALRGVKKPIGVSEYELTRALPTNLQSSLPTIEEIEAELATESAGGKPKSRRGKKPASGKRGKR